MYKLNGSSGDKTGLGIMLKVMSGDVVDVYGKSAYHLNTGQTPGNTSLITSALTSFISAIAGTSAISSAGKGATATTLSASTTTTSGLKYLLDTARTVSAGAPKAAINWILLDEQFKPVTSNSGYDAVNSTGDVIKTHHDAVSITRNGYLYVYCSNESNIDVFFDNLQVIQTRSALLAEDHYSPWGLQLKALCSSAAGKLENLRKFNNGSELQHKEFSDGTGLEWYATQYRMYDPQLGRWHVIDPKPDYSQSLYSAMGNNPVLNNDALGDSVINRDATRLANAQAAYDAKNYAGDKMEKKDFKNKADYKEYKKLKSEVGNAQKAFDHTQAAIDNFKAVDPENFAKVNNLTYTNANGDVKNVDVMVSTADASDFGGGKTGIAEPKDRGNIPGNKIYTTIGISVSVTANVLAHEFGHSIAIAANPVSYYNSAIGDPDHNCQDPANRNGELSKIAIDWQEEYDTKRNNIKH